MDSYEFKIHGKRVTCVAFGSMAELYSRELENMVTFLDQSLFIFTMYKILKRISAPSKQESARRSKRMNCLMCVYVFTFLVFELIMMFLKSYVFRRPNLD